MEVVDLPQGYLRIEVYLTASMCISLYTGVEDSVKQRFPEYKFIINGIGPSLDSLLSLC